MRNSRYVAAGMGGFILLSAPLAFANAASLSVQSISPGTNVVVKSALTFVISASGFNPQFYHVSDSFSGSSVSVNDIAGVGNFSWMPLPSDVGTHVLTISANDLAGDVANTTQTITVAPAPSISVGPVAPSHAIMAGTQLTFSVSTSGFTNPSFIASDSFNGSTVGDSNIDAAGNFSWTPIDIGQNGEHTINIFAHDASGFSASVDVPVLVGPGPSLAIQSIAPGTNVSPLQTLSFTVNAINFTPNAFMLTDIFPGSTLTNAAIGMTGLFSWTPQVNDVGTHLITIVGTVGVFGQRATTTQQIIVLGPNGSAPATTTASSTAGTSLAALQVQLAFLQSKITGLSGSSTTRANATTASSPRSVTMFQSPLRYGQSGPDVLALQKRLAALGFLSAKPNGHFGPATLDALIQFQKAKNISLVDQLGDATRAALNQ